MTPSREFREREVAWRVFAHELNASRVEVRGAGDRGRSYLLSPLGATMNRVLLSGRIVGVDRMAGENPLLRARVEDPTGSCTVTGSSFHPRTLAYLSQVVPPQEVLVIGKTHCFVSERGVSYISVRAEAIVPVDPVRSVEHLLDIAEATTERLVLGRTLRRPDPPGREELLNRGIPPMLADGALEAVAGYPGLDLEPYTRAVETVVSRLESMAVSSTGPSAGA